MVKFSLTSKNLPDRGEGGSLLTLLVGMRRLRRLVRRHASSRCEGTEGSEEALSSRTSGTLNRWTTTCDKDCAVNNQQEFKLQEIQ